MIRQCRKLICLGLLLALASSCGGGSSGGGSSSGGGTSGIPDNPADDLGMLINEQLPGTIVSVSQSDSYDVAIQIGGTVLVEDSLSTNDTYQVENNISF